MNLVRTTARISSSLVLLGLLALQANASLVPVNLRCGMRVDPLGIGDPAPRLSWQLQSSGQARGEKQTAYQVQVGSSAGAADLWDSGIVQSPETIDIVYQGQPLTSRQQCFWRVRVYDGDNAASAWSDSARWSVGLLSTGDWAAQWIGYDAAYTPTPQQTAERSLFNASGIKWVRSPGQVEQGGLHHSALRKQVVLPVGQTMTNAVMALYADNVCGLFVNGQQSTNLSLRWEATARINVTAMLHTGTNLVALSVTNTDAQEPARLIGRLVVQFASGTVANIPVDASWKAASWPPGNWTQPNYDDAAWAAPELSDSPWGTPSLNEIVRMPVPFLRKDFTTSQTVRRATVYVTALGTYELRLNGQKVGNDVLTPGWTHFPKRVYYQTYDVTEMVRNGANTLGAILGDGWYASVLGYKGARNNYGGNPRLLAQLELELSDGTKQTIPTDPSWKASYGPIRFSDLLLGSEYDARLELPGWDAPGYDATSWAPVVAGLSDSARRYADVTATVAAKVSNNRLNFLVNNANLGGDPAYGFAKVLEVRYRLGTSTQTNFSAENTTIDIGGTGQTLTVVAAYYGDPASLPGKGGFQVQAAVTEPSRCLETLPAVALTEPKPGCYTFDLGQNMVGWVRLQLSGNTGDRITVRHGEMLNPDGSVYTANLRGANSTDFFIFGTNGTTVFEPRFTFHGFRYVEVRGLRAPPTLNAVTGIVVNSDMPLTGDFACSSPLVNQLFHNIIWGQKGNYLEVPTDCPQRDERLGWSGDTQFFVPTAAYNFDVQTFFRRHMVTLCQDSQYPDGSFAVVAPDVGSGSGGTAWGDAGWICPYNMYRVYGDTNIIADHYDSFVRCGEFDAAHASNYIINSLPGDFGDWVHLGGAATSKVMDTAYYAYYAQAMSEMAAAIGRTADAASYAALRSNIVAAFATFFNPDGSFKDRSSQTGYALAFSMDLVPPALRNRVAQKFAESLAAFDHHLATGFIGTPRLLPGLHAAGRDDLAYKLLLQESYPSWLFQVKLGATTMWERWDGWTPSGGFQTIGMNSFNHYAFGAVGEYLYGTVGGISPAAAGYRAIRIKPVPGEGLTWARTSYQSTRGFISTAWTNTGSAFHLDVVIPPNTTAQVFVPTTNAPAITESGVPATTAPGVTFLAASNNCAVYLVGSGHYLWASPYQLPVTPHVIITTTNQVGTAGANLTPTWGVVTNGSLLARRAPDTTSGNFNMEPSLGTRLVSSLTAGDSLTISTGGLPRTTSANYVTGGNNAGTTLVYPLPDSVSGYDLTNITVYGGWGDNGRDQQAYSVYYSTVLAPTNFLLLGIVNFNPSIAGGLPSATRVTLTHSTGLLASNAVALKFDFSNPASENGYCGYAEITAFGKPSAALSVPPTLLENTQPATATMVAGSEIVFGATFASTHPIDYQWQTISGGVTNLLPGQTNAILVLTNLQLSHTLSYQLRASNALGVAMSPPAPLTVNPMPAAVNNILILPENQTGSGGTFTPAWTPVTNKSLIAGQLPGTASGNFSLEAVGRSVAALTTGNNLALTMITGSPGYPITTSTNYVTCGNGNGAGATLIYPLAGSATGYNLHRIVVHGGWADAGRDQQAYRVSYSTVAAPNTFTTLANVNFNPANPDKTQSATRVTLLPANGALATNVAAVKFDFTTPASENGYCGYGAISVFGVPPGVPPATNPTNLLAQVTGDKINFEWPDSHIGWYLQVQTNDLNLGLSTNWWNIEGSNTTNQVTLPVYATRGSVFYRLAYP